MDGVSRSVRTALPRPWILPRAKNCSPALNFYPSCGWAALSNPYLTHPMKKTVTFVTVFFMGWVMGFEPTNTGTTIRCLRPLGDTHHIHFADSKKIGTPEGTRTPDLLLRRQLLYPAELLAHFYGAGDGNRTRVTSLEGWCSTIELHPQIRITFAYSARK